MKTQITFFLIFIFLITNQTVFLQENSRGPLGDCTYLRNPQDVVIFSREYPNLNTYSAHQILNFQFFPGIGDSVITGPLFMHESFPVDGHDLHDFITGNFTGNSSDEIASVWETKNRSAVLAVSSVNKLTAELTDISLHSSDSLALIDLPMPPNIPEDSLWIYEGMVYRLLRLQKGNFDSDEKDELIFAYWSADSTVRIELYDDENNFTSPVSFISDQHLSAHQPIGPGDGTFRIHYFDIVASDFNKDGISELLLFGKDIDEEPSAKMFAALYEYNALSSSFTLRAKENVPHGLTLSDNDRMREIFATAGCMNPAGNGDGVVNISVCDPDHEPYKYAILSYDVSSDLSDISFSEPNDHGYIPSIISADANNDGYDEIFIQTNSDDLWLIDSLLVFSIDSTNNLRRMFGTRGTPFGGSTSMTTYYYSYSRYAFAVLDVDTDTSSTNWLPELMVGEISWPSPENPEYRTCIYNFVFDSTGNINGLELRKTIDGDPPEMFIAGNFMGGDIYLGKPARFAKTDILQPIVILNAPPIHFDVLDGIEWDISKSFEPNTCQFYSRYEKQSQSNVEVQTKVSQSWALSESFGAGFFYKMVGGSASLENRYGKKFSRVTGSSRTITVSEQIDAILEDEIFATIVDYDMWEYPVYDGDELIGHILVMDPMQVTNRWFSSKGWSANGYIPNHEIGNILSYQRFPTLASNEDVAALISGTYDNSYELGPSPLASWKLEYQDFISSQTETVNNIAIDLNVGASFFGISFGGKDTYNREEISTHQTSVTQNLVMSVHFDAIAMNLGEVRYTVTPYSYWAKNGALVIDYAVLPDLSPPGYTGTWWQVHYDSLADPAFILPWRLDPEKGFPLQDETKRFQTNEILFNSANPQPGDTIIIRSRIHNYSLAPTLAPVKVRFYVGDPDNGGTPITGIDGETDVSTASFIKSRESAVVEMKWKIPSGLPLYPRIYAKLDPDGEIDEIHENNNKGFSVLGRQNEIVDIKNDLVKPVSKYVLSQNYPNPFNPSTKITYEIPECGMVSIKVYDILGREIVTLVNEEKNPGQYEVEFQSSAGSNQLASGIYFYQLKAGDFIQTKKMILIK